MKGSVKGVVNESNEISHQPCPFESCGGKDEFSYNILEKTGYCFKCKRGYPSQEKVFDWAKETYPTKPFNVDIKKVTIKGTTFSDIRGLDPDVAKLYNIQLQLGDNDVPVRYAFKYDDNVKYRGYDEKKFWLKDRGSLNDLFGPSFNAGSSKRIYITEGEFDAASLYQILGKSYPVKSLPSSSLSEKFLKNTHEYLNSFDEIVYGGELDSAGKAAAEKLYSMFPEKFYYVPLNTYKDANDFLTNGAGDKLKWSALRPQRFSPDNFFVGDVEVEKAISTENPYEYVPTGHAALDDKIRGLVKGGLTFIKALRGQGKTELVRYFEIGLLRQDTRIALLHMEEMKSTTYRAMATYELGWNVRTKEDAVTTGFSEEQVIQAAQKIAGGENTVIFEMQSHDDPLQLLDYVRMAATIYGAEFVFIDHVQRLAYLSQSGVEGATSTLTTLGSRMAQLAKELNIGVVFISQVNDDGRTKYAASLEEEAIICVKLTRDTESTDDTERNTTHFYVDKNRPFAKLGRAGSVFYDSETTVLEEVVFEG